MNIQYMYIRMYLLYVTGNFVFAVKQFEQEQLDDMTKLDPLGNVHAMDEGTKSTLGSQPFFDNEVSFYGETFLF